MGRISLRSSGGCSIGTLVILAAAAEYLNPTRLRALPVPIQALGTVLYI